jgi:hypothetical protein
LHSAAVGGVHCAFDMCAAAAAESPKRQYPTEMLHCRRKDSFLVCMPKNKAAQVVLFMAITFIRYFRPKAFIMSCTGARVPHFYFMVMEWRIAKKLTNPSIERLKIIINSLLYGSH